MSKKPDSQTILAIGVLLVSFVALFISVRQTSIMSEQTRLLVEQNKAGAWPHLELSLTRSFSMSEEGDVELTGYVIGVTNKGTGPAIVEAVSVKYNGQPVRNWNELYEVANRPDSVLLGHSNSSIMNKVVAPNEEINIIDLDGNASLRNFVFSLGDKISIDICYRSVYEDYWKVSRHGFQTNLEQAKTEKITGCSVAPEELFVE